MTAGHGFLEESPAPGPETARARARLSALVAQPDLAPTLTPDARFLGGDDGDLEGPLTLPAAQALPGAAQGPYRHDPTLRAKRLALRGLPNVPLTVRERIDILSAQHAVRHKVAAVFVLQDEAATVLQALACALADAGDPELARHLVARWNCAVLDCRTAITDSDAVR